VRLVVLGLVDTQMLRRVPPAYSDGVYALAGFHRPNPMDISLSVFNGTTGLPSYRNRTALLVFFGEFPVLQAIIAKIIISYYLHSDVLLRPFDLLVFRGGSDSFAPNGTPVQRCNFDGFLPSEYKVSRQQPQCEI